ncbi:MAG: serine/threonine protein kinase [Halieaceae bacterium]|nr:serine/threonine protein kinase [Halieaceae bacterium]
MSGHPFDVLTPDTVIEAVEVAGYRSDARLLALNSYENRVYQVGIEDAEPLIVKFYRPQRWSAEQIAEEHRFSLELAEVEIPVVAPLRDERGETLHHHAGLLYALFPRRGGRAPDFDNPDNLLVLGRTLGRMHAVGATRPFTHRPALDGASIIDEARTRLPGAFVPADLTEAYVSLLDDLAAALQPALDEMKPTDFIRVHGDCHGGNILWRNDTAHFVDLDDCMSAPAIQDLWMFLSGERHEQEMQLGELIAGYEEFNEFSARQLRWIEAMRSLRIIRHASWLARRWDDPAFPRAFPWFEGPRFWSDHILELREQFARVAEPPLRLL